MFGGAGAPAPAVACEAVPLIQDHDQGEAVRMAVRVLLDALPTRLLASSIDQRVQVENQRGDDGGAHASEASGRAAGGALGLDYICNKWSDD